MMTIHYSTSDNDITIDAAITRTKPWDYGEQPSFKGEEGSSFVIMFFYSRVYSTVWK